MFCFSISLQCVFVAAWIDSDNPPRSRNHTVTEQGGNIFPAAAPWTESKSLQLPFPKVASVTPPSFPSPAWASYTTLAKRIEWALDPGRWLSGVIGWTPEARRGRWLPSSTELVALLKVDLVELECQPSL